MAKAVPALDISVTDHRWACRRCPYRHQPGSACPRPGLWLGTGGTVKPPTPAREAAPDG